MDEQELQIRVADPMDDSALESFADRMANFPVPPWRTPGEIASSYLPALRKAVHQSNFDGVLLIAERGRGNTLGGVLVTVHRDLWNDQLCARVDVLAVRHGEEGGGVAGALMRAAEAWAREQGLRRMFCELFDSNWRAQQFCEHVGFQRDTVRFLKDL